MKVKKKCSVSECDRNSRSSGMCDMHYKRVWRNGTVEIVKKQRGLEEAYALVTARSEPQGDCILWRGYEAGGYGKIHVKGVPVGAHRIVKARLSGIALSNLPPVHHKCANRLCVKPDHLQLVTEAENKAEMLARNYYIKRIQALEEALREKDPDSPLLN